MGEYAKTVAVDVDGVLARYDGWKGPGVIGEPIRGAKEFMESLRKDGFRVIIHTTRTKDFEGEDHVLRIRSVRKWLEENNIPYDDLHTEIGKPIACAYVDDRAVSCRPQEGNVTGIAFGGALLEIEKLSKDEK